MSVVKGIFAVLLGAGLLLLLVLGLSGCSPEVWEIHAGPKPGPTVNILFLGDGFDERELQSYRAATYYLSQQLLEVEPFCHLGERLRFFRVDVCDPTGEVGKKLPCDSCSLFPKVPVDASFKEPQPPLFVSGSEGPYEEDLDVRRCQTAGSCESVWPTDAGIAEIFELARHAPDVAAVVVLANARAKAGNGFWDVQAGAPALAVITLPMKETAGVWAISTTGYRLFAHELGHTLGLVDEYAVGPRDGPATADDRNVWMPPAPGPWTTVEPIPWEALLPAGCDSMGMEGCCGTLSLGTCVPCLGMNPLSTCWYVPAVCQHPGSLCPGPDCVPPPTCQGQSIPDPAKDLCDDVCDGVLGAWEGAAYREIGRYRSSENCRMRSLAYDGPLCPACRSYLWTSRFCDPAIPGECQDPYGLDAPCP